MVNVRHHNPALQARLRPIVDNADAKALVAALKQLTNSEARTAGVLLADDLLPNMAEPARFTKLFIGVVRSNPKAYLGTFLKAAARLYNKGQLDLTAPAWFQFAQTATGIDCRKSLDAFLPLAKNADEVSALLTNFTNGTPQACIPQLLRTGTTAAYFHMFRLLRQVEDERELLKTCYLQLLKRGGHRDFNMACIIRCYFGLSDLPGQFSLDLPPYKLSRLDLTPEKFAKILNQ